MTYRLNKKTLALILESLEQTNSENFDRAGLNKFEFLQEVSGLLLGMESTNMDYIYIVGRDVNKI